MAKRKSTKGSTAFFDYLKPYLEVFPKKSIEREVIRLVLFLAYKSSSTNINSIFTNWDLLYFNYYTPDEAIELCTDFIKNNLCLDMSFAKAISFFKEKFPQKNSP